MTNSINFDETKYARIDNFIDKTTIEIISQYMENTIRRGIWKELAEFDETIDPTVYAYYADPLTEVLLTKCKELVEVTTERELLPTYSYSRIYQPGEELKVHVDREACEISVTVNVASKGEVSAVYTKYKDKTEQHILNPGDALIYMGCDVDHWREPLKDGQLNVQFMLHYVDKNGPFASFEKDTRPMLGTDSSTKRVS
jgi:hypothetical protein